MSDSQENEIVETRRSFRSERRDTPTSKDVCKDENGKNFKQRVEEFAMWKDEGTFQDMEYKRRRDEKMKMKGVIRSDRRLIWSSRLYIPTIGLIMISGLVLLLSSLDGLGENTFLWNHSEIFQILGGVCLTIGIIALMAIAAYSYHREDSVRARHGYPSLFVSSLRGEVSSKDMEESAMLQNTFVDRPKRQTDRLHRLNSIESRCTGNTFLGQSFSSTSTAMSWVHKHRGYTAGHVSKPSIRRENSDSALDKIFARNRLLSWQMEGAAHSPTSGDDGNNSADNSERRSSNDNETPSDSKERKGGDVSQIESSVSMASSGYCSNISTQCLSHNYNNSNEHRRQPLSRHLSEPSHKVTVHIIAKRDRMLSEGIIPDEDTFQEQHHSVVQNIPIINIECV